MTNENLKTEASAQTGTKVETLSGKKREKSSLLKNGAHFGSTNLAAVQFRQFHPSSNL